MKKKLMKGIAVYLAFSILFQIISPTVAMALTTGPSQPEMQAFEPVGTTEMVDPFSGDFNYNIPLLTVPGPNGGYPINLSYHSGIGMEQEASWVGLGWNINAGEINRQMRGIPDDFNGDGIRREMSMQPNKTIAVEGKASFELVNMDANKGIAASFSGGLAWNSYKGLGFTAGTSLAYSSGQCSGFNGKLGTNYNSLTGSSDLTASISYQVQGDNCDSKFGMGLTRNSIEGYKNLTLDASATRKKEVSYLDKEALDRNLKAAGSDAYSQAAAVANSMTSQTIHGRPAGAGASYSGTSFIPHADMPQGGFNISTEFELGTDIMGMNAYFGGNVMYTRNDISDKKIDFKGYGYMYSQHRHPTDEQRPYELMDFNREKDAMLTQDIPAMPTPTYTNDAYVVKGQGIGGVFRPYRSDIGILYDPRIVSKNFGVSTSMEVGLGNPLKLGSDITLSASLSYSGPWRNETASWHDFYSNYDFQDKSTTDPLFEPYYFRNTGDMTADYNDQSSRFGTDIPFPIKLKFVAPSASEVTNFDAEEIMAPFVDVRVNNDNNLGNNKRGDRRSRSQSMSALTADQMAQSTYGQAWSKNINVLGSFPRTEPPTSFNYSASYIQKDHIAEMSVVNPDGNRYIYAIPAYNKVHKECSFTVEAGTTGDNIISDNGKLVSYTTTDASDQNDNYDDHFYSSKSISPYAHSYLLTAIVSPDYVDLTGNGPSEDDYGYYVKFNYSKLSSDYGWRSPYAKAGYSPGIVGLKNDDKAGYTYGEKETWYLTSVETKTHVAEFKLGNRLDGYGAASEHNGPVAVTYPSSQQLKKLEEINLYSKSDPNYASGTPVPIKTVKFLYSYDLCGNVQNNSGAGAGGDPTITGNNALKGKLTLKQVWFEYQGNNKGSLSPYIFDYNETNASDNPDFSTLQEDRWGNYSKNDRYSSTGGYNVNDPYTIQREDFDEDGTDENTTPTGDDIVKRNQQASAWCLKKITLPSGGNINVSYEADDYAYVQEKSAMEMLEIKNLGYKSGGTFTTSDKMSTKNDLVFFAMDKTSPTSADVWNAIQGIDLVYFKVYEKLKKDFTFGADVYDYVEGYAEVDGPVAVSDDGTKYGIAVIAGKTYGYLKIKMVTVEDHPLVSGPTKTHPFRKAGWQYLKLNRTDLLYPSTSNDDGSDPATSKLVQTVSAITGLFTSQFQLFTGYYKYCMTANYCHFINLSETDHPSFIRLNVPDGIKYGGGHRVKQLTVTDNWTDGAASTYGQEYSYRLKNGKSSGVAEYEPLIGGEEIPHHMPVRYSGPHFLLKNKNLYLEKPYCESYYPSASVGYSRVVIKSITPSGITRTHTESGITEYTFYTAKDFPVIVSPSNLLHKKFHPPHISIPFIGSAGFENNGFSQRFVVETNNMHGKPKSIATYAHNADLYSSTSDPVPVTKTEFIYKTDAAYSENAANHLNNTVDVLFNDADHKQALLGYTDEFFMDMRETSSVALTGGGQFNMELFYYPILPNISVTPTIDYSESLFKSMVAMHIISRNGILMQTRVTNEGSVSTTQNLMFDGSTGQPLLTSVTNDFDKPVYTYLYDAQWPYYNMGSAVSNIGAIFNVTTASGIFSYTGASNYFITGDEVYLDDPSSSTPLNIYTVTDISGSNVTLKDAAGTSPANNTYNLTVIRSGRRNQMAIHNGKIVSLSNPVTERVFPLFAAWNSYVATNNSLPPANTYQLNFSDCATGSALYAFVHYVDNTIEFDLQNCGTDKIVFPAALTGVYTLAKAGPYVYATNVSTNVVTKGRWDIGSDGSCLYDCLPNVLHADASVFKDDWSTELSGVVDDVNNNNHVATTVPSSSDMTSANTEYQFGAKGIWRNWKSYAYQVTRDQLALTDISKDGTYNNFALFDWTNATSGANPLWTKASEVTEYSPYGYELENKDALGIYSSALYGYDNSLVTAISANATYYETAFDGFEDYPSAGYPTSGTPKGHGHIHLQPNTGSTYSLSSSISHTGKTSMRVTAGSLYFNSGTNFFQPQASKTYTLSTWIYYPNGTPSITITGATINSSTIGKPIEGWRKYDVVFTTTGTSITATIGSASGDNNFYIDDLRVMPFQSTIKTYVYDKEKLWLLAELDNQNYATFYNYDEEGTLTQVKKETEKGIVTIKTTRSNVKR